MTQTREPETTEEAKAASAAAQAPETGELASVVVAAEREADASTPWHVTLRPWLFCLLFLLVAEVAARAVFDHTLCLHHERFDNFPSAASEDVFVDQIRRDKAFRVVIVGDSVVVGPSLLDRDGTIPEQLEQVLRQRLPGRNIHVWNFSVAGARSLDQLCLLTKVLEARPDMLIVPGNYYIVAGGVNSQLPMNLPWTARNVSHLPAPLDRELPPLGAKERFEGWATDLFEKNSRLLGMRQAINGMLFGVQPRVPFDSPNPFVMAGSSLGKRVGKLRVQTWSKRGIPLTAWKYAYERPIGPENRNAQGYRYVVQMLERSGIPAFTYLTPQNPVLVAVTVPNGQYEPSRRCLSGFFASPTVPFRDFSDAVPDQWFQDNDHMLAEGNRILAERIADAITPTIGTRLAAEPRRWLADHQEAN